MTLPKFSMAGVNVSFIVIVSFSNWVPRPSPTLMSASPLYINGSSTLNLAVSNADFSLSVSICRFLSSTMLSPLAVFSRSMISGSIMVPMFAAMSFNASANPPPARLAWPNALPPSMALSEILFIEFWNATRSPVFLNSFIASPNAPPDKISRSLLVWLIGAPSPMTSLANCLSPGVNWLTPRLSSAALPASMPLSCDWNTPSAAMARFCWFSVSTLSPVSLLKVTRFFV